MIKKLKLLGYKVKTKLEHKMLWLLLMLPLPAFASGDEITTIAYNVCDYLSGTLSRVVAVVCIVVAGYRTLTGRLDWRYMASIAIGLGLIIGGTYYGKTFFGGV